MEAAGIGALVGLVIAVADFALLRLLATRVDLPETKRVLHVTGVVQLIAMAIMGWFIGPLFVGE